MVVVVSRSLASPLEAAIDVCAGSTLECPNPNTAEFRAWLAPEHGTSIDARGLNHCEPGSPRKDLDDHRSKRPARPDEARHSGASSTTQFSSFGQPAVFALPLRSRSGTERLQGRHITNADERRPISGPTGDPLEVCIDGVLQGRSIFNNPCDP